MTKDEALPTAGRGFTWRPLAERSVAELRALAAEYRKMAASATTAPVMKSLQGLAARYDALADQREERGEDLLSPGPA